MAEKLTPHERLVRNAVTAVAREVVDRLAEDPDDTPDAYGDLVAFAAHLLEREAKRVGMHCVAPTPVPSKGEGQYGIDPTEMYTVKQAAKLLKLTPKHVYVLGRRPGPKGLRVTRVGPKGGKTLVSGAELIAYMDRRTGGRAA